MNEKIELWLLNDDAFSEDTGTYDRKVEELASQKLREKKGEFPPELQTYLTRKIPDIFCCPSSDTSHTSDTGTPRKEMPPALKEQANTFYQKGDFVEFLKQPSLVSELVRDIANCVHEVLATAKVAITKYHLDSATWNDREGTPPKLIIKDTESKELNRKLKRIENVLEDIKETTFDSACVLGMNWQSAGSIDCRESYSVLKRDLMLLLESYAACTRAAIDICNVQKKDEMREQARLLPYRHLVSAIAQHFSKLGLRTSSAEESDFYAVIKIAFGVVEEILIEEFACEPQVSYSPHPRHLIDAHLNDLRTPKT